MTEDGEFFGSQQAVTLHNEVNDVATITVRFIVDGKDIRFADNNG